MLNICYYEVITNYKKFEVVNMYQNKNKQI